MNIGDLKRCIEDLPDSMDLVVCEGQEALYVCGLGTAAMGVPAAFPDSDMGIVRNGITVFEITVRDKP